MRKLVGNRDPLITVELGEDLMFRGSAPRGMCVSTRFARKVTDGADSGVSLWLAAHRSTPKLFGPFPFESQQLLNQLCGYMINAESFLSEAFVEPSELAFRALDVVLNAPGAVLYLTRSQHGVMAEYDFPARRLRASFDLSAREADHFLVF